MERAGGRDDKGESEASKEMVDESEPMDVINMVWYIHFMWEWKPFKSFPILPKVFKGFSEGKGTSCGLMVSQLFLATQNVLQNCKDPLPPCFLHAGQFFLLL